MTPPSPLESFARLMGVETQPTPELEPTAPQVDPRHQPPRGALEFDAMLRVLREELRLREIGNACWAEATEWFRECRKQEIERAGAYPDNERTE